MRRRPRRHRGGSPPRNSRRSCRSASRSPGTLWSSGGNCPTGRRHPCISLSRARGVVRFRPGGITASAPRPSGASSIKSAPEALPPTSAPNAGPSRRSGTPARSCACPDGTVGCTGYPSASTTVTAPPFRPPWERRIPWFWPSPFLRPPPGRLDGPFRRGRTSCPAACPRYAPKSHPSVPFCQHASCHLHVLPAPQFRRSLGEKMAWNRTNRNPSVNRLRLPGNRVCPSRRHRGDAWSDRDALPAGHLPRGGRFLNALWTLHEGQRNGIRIDLRPGG